MKEDDKGKPDLLSVFMRFKDENGNSCSDFLKDSWERHFFICFELVFLAA
jgi:hypothetical protein